MNSKDKIILIILLVLLCIIPMEFTTNDKSKIIEGVLNSRTIKNDIYNSNYQNIESLLSNIFQYEEYKLCTSLNLSNRNHVEKYNGDYICNKSDFNPSEFYLFPPKTGAVGIELDGESLGEVNWVRYINMDVYKSYFIMMLLIIYLFFVLYKLHNGSKKIDHFDFNKNIFIKNKKMFPIRSDTFAFSVYGENYCNITLTNGKQYKVRCSLEALEALIGRKCKRERRNVLISENIVFSKRNNKFILKIGEKEYEV
ncbi:hypothetical protein [Enterovibrio nigricans]|uniref:Uncharacterized protein n=1 Tax=Enterovibrio nigricans DSM 22720 TaxID=1121868 RepID=A0A1T4V8F9_9GAMM|nr:hypothetical protein [Enterovibrio nigricans]PKF50214.1 hypothetical protein AT251_12905 [Enterovibrio nigricans]SKA61239.1 hypothetical protein SAMN02745132_03445 [Enterovibrio nigricans DSM 22720]